MTDPPADPPVGQPAVLTEHLLRGLRVAQSVIVLAILIVLMLPNVRGTLDLYAHPATGPAWWGALLAVATADAVLVVRRRFWGAARWPVAVAVLAVASVAVEPEAAVEPLLATAVVPALAGDSRDLRVISTAPPAPSSRISRPAIPYIAIFCALVIGPSSAAAAHA